MGPGGRNTLTSIKSSFFKHPVAVGIGAAALTAIAGMNIAAWSVAHAQEYGLSQVAYSGATWVNDVETTGWKEGGKAGARQVELA